jgi:hypothetical protein
MWMIVIIAVAVLAMSAGYFGLHTLMGDMHE